MCNKKTLRAWRRDRDVTQKELAARVGVSNVTISLYESVGLGQAKTETLMKIISELDINFDQLEINPEGGEGR